MKPIELRSENFVLNFKDFPHKRFYRIDGVNYSIVYELLKTSGQNRFPIGVILKIISRDDNTSEFTRLFELEEKIIHENHLEQ